MARKGATERQGERRLADPKRGNTSATTLRRALLLMLGLDAAIALVQLYVHLQLSSSGGSYTSFCNVNASVNCDAVLSSRFSTLVGLPISLWALAKDALMAALVRFRGRPGSPARLRAALLLTGLGAWTLVFSLYMAFVATSTIGKWRSR